LQSDLQGKDDPAAQMRKGYCIKDIELLVNVPGLGGVSAECSLAPHFEEERHTKTRYLPAAENVPQTIHPLLNQNRIAT